MRRLLLKVVFFLNWLKMRTVDLFIYLASGEKLR